MVCKYFHKRGGTNKSEKVIHSTKCSSESETSNKFYKFIVWIHPCALLKLNPFMCMLLKMGLIIWNFPNLILKQNPFMCMSRLGLIISQFLKQNLFMCMLKEMGFDNLKSSKYDTVSSQLWLWYITYLVSVTIHCWLSIACHMSCKGLRNEPFTNHCCVCECEFVN